MSAVEDRVRQLHATGLLRAAAGSGTPDPAAVGPGRPVAGGPFDPAATGARRPEDGGTSVSGADGPVGPVVGVVGGDVPVEIIEACGARPFRLSAAEREPGAEAVGLLGAAVDSVFHSILDRILAGEFGFLRGLVVSRDCQGSLRLFYVLRMLAEQGRGVPEVHLVDLLHLPRESTRDYNAGQLAKLAEVVAGWTGIAVTPDSLYEARKARGRLAAGLRDLRARRAAGAVPGALALRVYALAQTETPADCLAVLDAVLGGAPAVWSPQGRPRVFLTGSTVDQVSVYDRLEAAGVLIAGEDHNWGDPVADLWDEHPEPLDLPSACTAIAAHRLRHGPMASTSGLSDRARFSAAGIRRCGAELVLSVARRNDPAPGWDRPGLIRELGPDARVVALSVAAHTWSADEFGTATALLTREDREATAR
ncbi:2-hydroxyacyl-CoA dehydratase family protein [Nocardia carnea]|uniref:2-hydroxyacyl-CoA dehydratase family protein n=3 Tax=Nocardia carnea TaxID=37328 RepID=UPI0024564A77|nr:2-hydroxyacyl-CoA dehydratase family protein [Nocardia carnea]